MTTSTQQMTQSSYPSAPEAGVAGMQATTDPVLVRSAANLARKAYLVTIATVANSQLYRLVVKFLSRASATWGVEQTVNVDYTSDGSATAAEIASNLVANLNAASVPCTAQALHADGPLQVYGDTPAQDFTLTTANAYLADPSVDSAEIPFGVMVCKDQSDSEKCRLPFTESDVTSGILGLAVRNLAQENLASGNAAYPIGEPVSYAKKGVFWARVDQAVSAGDDAFVRFTPNGSNAQRGILRKDRDGTAQVITFTPSAANATPYMVSIGAYSYSYLSDGSATAAEIVADLLAQINLQSSLHGVAASGSTTLILTANAAGKAFDYSSSANMVAAVTTAAVIRAAAINAKFRSAASAGGVAKLELDLGL